MKIKAFLLCTFVCITAVCRADEGKRIALVIGNDAYATRPLQNAVNDARAMDRALQSVGFRTIVKENASKEDMEKSFIQMLELLGPDDTALVFYAGHAVQIDSENQLIPVDFTQASSVIDAKYKTFSVARITDELARLRHKRSIIILDACRSNPVTEGLQGGLVMPLNEGKETYIAFSTSPNHVAMDNPNGHNSFFTEALAELITNAKDAPLDDIMTRVRKQVESMTAGNQSPWSQTNFSSKFYFHVQANSSDEVDATLIDKWLSDAKTHERRGHWAESLDLLNRIITSKPGGAAEAEARRRLPYVTERREAQAAYDAGKYAEAAAAFKRAYDLNRFTDAALQVVNCYLLADDLEKAVEMVHEIRLRGSSADIDRSDLLLKSLAPVEAKAGAELQAGVPAPPPLRELFPDFPFRRVDVDSSLSVARNASTSVVTQLMAALPAPPAPATITVATAAETPAQPGAAAAPLTLDTLHVEVIAASSSKTRDFTIEKINHADERVNMPSVQRQGTPLKVTSNPTGAAITVDGDPDLKCDSPCLLTLPASVRTLKASLDGFRTETRDVSKRVNGEPLSITLTQEFGILVLEGQAGNTPVYVNGKVAAGQVPARVKMPVGKYNVRVVEHGKVLTSGPIEVTESTMPVFTVIQQQAKSE